MYKQNACLAEKDEYVAIDFARFFFALCVVSIHWMTFFDVSLELNYWETQLLSRLAVPFYFMTSGFFIGSKMNDWKKVKKYVLRIMGMNVLYTIIYWEVVLQNYDNIWIFLRDFFTVGSVIQLWYFWALIIATLMLYWVVHYAHSEKLIIIGGGILYTFGVLVNAYSKYMDNFAWFSNIHVWYERFFQTTRNGVFFGFFYVGIGYLLWKHREEIRRRHYLVWAMLAFGLMNLEVYRFLYPQEQSMLFLLPFVVTFLFVGLCFIKLPKSWMKFGKALREIAILIFAWHMYVFCKFGLRISGWGPTLGVRFTVKTGMLTAAISLVIWSLSKIKRRPFCWLRYLY